MKAEIIKILAEGSYKSYVTIQWNTKNGIEEHTFYITRDLYYHLKKMGVPTGQKLYHERKSKQN